MIWLLVSFEKPWISCDRFNVEGFEVWSLGLFVKSKGSKFRRACLIQGRRVRGLVAWVLSKVEGFEVWARVFDARSKGSRFGRLGCF